MSTHEAQRSPNYFRIAWQSALAAGLCLGFPAGLLLWLILLREIFPAAVLDRCVAFLQANGLNKISVLAFCSLLWSYLLARLSGYQPWLRIGLATVLGIFAGWFSPLANLDGWLSDELPIPTLYAFAMCGLVFSVTSCVGLAYGFILRSAKAALTLAVTTGFASTLAMLFTIALFDQFGIRVGGMVPLAMSKVTTVSLMMSALAGGMLLGVGFSRFVNTENHKSI